MHWKDWIETNWSRLTSGEKISVREGWLDHPRWFPELFRLVDGWPDGQRCDYAASLRDGSRIHVQCYAADDGTRMLRVHRDKWDPNHSLGHAVLHGLFETPLGPIAAAAGIGILLIAAASSD